jgi:hypothetical protein
MGPLRGRWRECGFEKEHAFPFFKNKMGSLNKAGLLIVRRSLSKPKDACVHAIVNLYTYYSYILFSSNEW